MNSNANFRTLFFYPRNLYQRLVSKCLEDFDNSIKPENIANYYRILDEQQKELDEIGKGGVVDNTSRTILHDDRYIYLHLKAKDVDVYADYSPDLYSFLARPHCCSYNVGAKGYVQIELMEHRRNGKSFSPILSRFLYYYKEIGMDAETFAGEFKDINERSIQNEIQIDHACNNIHINCGWNLSAVRQSANGAKTNLIAQIKPPYYCLPVVTRSGEYRVEYGIINFEEGEFHHVLCRNIEDLISFLRSLIGAHSNEYIMKKYGSPAERYAHDKHALFFANSFDTMTRTADRLLAMDEENFMIWNSDMGSGDIFLKD